MRCQPAARAALSHCLPLRRLCQDRISSRCSTRAPGRRMWRPASIQAVVNQTIAGLAQGRKIDGQGAVFGRPAVLLQGPAGPLPRDAAASTMRRQCSRRTAGLPWPWARPCTRQTVGQAPVTFDELVRQLRECKQRSIGRDRLKPLFADPAEYDAFCQRHARATVSQGRILRPTPATPGWASTAAATTTKLALISEDNEAAVYVLQLQPGQPRAARQGAAG